MKSILLASASVIAFAGAAAAEITWSGSATLGYNDTTYTTTGTTTGFTTGGVTATEPTSDTAGAGFYWDASIDVTLSQTLDNGLTAGATFGFDVVDNGLGMAVEAGDYALFIESDMAALRFGDVDPASSEWSGVDGMEVEFFDRDDHLDTGIDDNGTLPAIHTPSGAGYDAILRGEVSYGSVSAVLSYGVEVDDSNNGRVGTPGIAASTNDIDAMQLAVTADLGQFNVVAMYQDSVDVSWHDGIAIVGTVQVDSRWGLAVSTTFGSADVTLAYADDGTETSTGVSVSAPVGPVVLGAYYSDNSINNDVYGLTVDYENGPYAVSVSYENDGADDWGIEGSYDVGNGLMVYAGVVDAGDDYYVAGEMDLGGGASLLVSYADDTDNDEAAGDDDIGANDYMVGATVEVSFEF